MGITGETIDYKRPLLPQIADVEVIVNGFGIIDKSFIDVCPNLQLIQQTGIGIDNVDVRYCTLKSILVADSGLYYGSTSSTPFHIKRTQGKDRLVVLGRNMLLPRLEMRIKKI